MGKAIQKRTSLAQKQSRKVGNASAVAVFRSSHSLRKMHLSQFVNVGNERYPLFRVLQAFNARFIDEEIEDTFVQDDNGAPLATGILSYVSYWRIPADAIRNRPLAIIRDIFAKYGAHEVYYGAIINGKETHKQPRLNHKQPGSGAKVKSKITLKSRYKELEARGVIDNQAFLAFLYGDDWPIREPELPLLHLLDIISRNVCDMPLPSNWIANGPFWLEQLAQYENVQAEQRRIIETNYDRCDIALQDNPDDESAAEQFEYWRALQERLNLWEDRKEFGIHQIATRDINTFIGPIRDCDIPRMAITQNIVNKQFNPIETKEALFSPAQIAMYTREIRDEDMGMTYYREAYPICGNGNGI